MLPEERQRFGALQQRHYLPQRTSRWLELALHRRSRRPISWCCRSFTRATPHPKARERATSWAPRQRMRRLCFVVNNSRFVVLAERQKCQTPILRVVASCLERFSADLQQRRAQPVLVVKKYLDASGLGPDVTGCAVSSASKVLKKSFSRQKRAKNSDVFVGQSFKTALSQQPAKWPNDSAH